MEPTLYKLADETFVLSLKTTSMGTQRLPTHFIMLMDTSDSMADCNKLANVKHSASLVLHFLGPQDRLSVVTFGDDAETHARAVACTPEQKEALKAMFERIRTDGCTNLSAGLIAVREILSRREATNPLKTGILLLTDGHANRGVSRANVLCDMVRQIHEEYPDVTLQVVGYGTDHNAELLNSIAEQTQGTYSLVDDKEGAATTIGDTLGNLFTCVAQRVAVTPGEKIVLEGSQFQVTGTSDGSRVQVGDLYQDSETYLLFKPVPNAGTGAPWGIGIHGTLLPSMEAVQQLILLEDAVTEIPPAVQKSVTLTRIRYRISAMFKELRDFRLGTTRFREVLEKVEVEEASLATFGDDPVAKMLLAECTSLRSAVEVMREGTRGDIQDISARLVSHEAYTNLGRGTTQSIHRQRRRFSDAESEEMEDPNVPTLMRPGRVRFPDPTASLTSSQYMTSPCANPTTRRVTQLMAAMSQGGEADAAGAAHTEP